MNRTTSKRNEQLSWIVLALAFAAVIPNLPEIVVSALSDDYSKYSTFENLMSLVLGVLATVGLLYFFYTLFDIVIYSRALCLVDDKGIKVRYRLLLKKDKQFTWNDIEKVILATTASDKPELELRCFTKDFMTAGRGLARKFPPESKLWGSSFFSVHHQSHMVTIQYSPELSELVKKYHPEIIFYPNKKLVEGYIEYLYPGNDEYK